MRKARGLKAGLNESGHRRDKTEQAGIMDFSIQAVVWSDRGPESGGWGQTRMNIILGEREDVAGMQLPDPKFLHVLGST